MIHTIGVIVHCNKSRCGVSISTSVTTTPCETVKHALKSTASLYYAQYLQCLICCSLTGKHACGGVLCDRLLFPAASPVQLMNDRSITRESLSGSFHLSFCTDLPLPAPYILFIYLQGDHCFLQVYQSIRVCVCVCVKKTERRTHVISALDCFGGADTNE